MEEICRNRWESIAVFAQEELGIKLYGYQEEVAEAIIYAIEHRLGGIITVMFARQMGKNQISAVIEAYLLANSVEGSIIKVAPTANPQVLNSMQRLKHTFMYSSYTKRVWRTGGHMMGLAVNEEEKKLCKGPSIKFLSAAPHANIVGATASLLLEIDEAQDVTCEKFNRELQPMASTTNATIVLYGTAWSDNDLLAQIKQENLVLEERNSYKRHYQADYKILAEINPAYKRFVEGAIERLGEDSLDIRTQYFLIPMTAGDHLLDSEMQKQMQGEHRWLNEPDAEAADEKKEDEVSFYIAGMDVGGDARIINLQEGQGKRDSSVITVCKVTYNELDVACLAIVRQYWWTGMDTMQQYLKTTEIMKRWNIRLLVIDRTGLGDHFASLLEKQSSSQKVKSFVFTRENKSRLAYEFMSFIRAGRIRMYQEQGSEQATYQECWKQLKNVRCHSYQFQKIDMYVPQNEGHDDFVISMALCCEAVKEIKKPTPYVKSAWIEPPQDREYEGERETLRGRWLRRRAWDEGSNSWY